MTQRKMSVGRFALSASAAILLTGLSACGSFNGVRDIPEYLDSDFANAAPKEFITVNDLAKIKVGDSRLFVKNRLGRPLLSDQSDESRYDYVLRTVKDGKVDYAPYAVYFDDKGVTKFGPLERLELPPVAEAAPAAAAPADASPVAAAPEPAAASPVAMPAGDLEGIVQAWAAAWAAKDYDKYVSFYSDKFQTAGGRAAWAKQRKARLSAPASITLNISDVKVTQVSETIAQVAFTQDYASNIVKEKGTKTLVMTKASGEWKIQRETFVKG